MRVSKVIFGVVLGSCTFSPEPPLKPSVEALTALVTIETPSDPPIPRKPVERLLGSFSTQFKTEKLGRAYNITLGGQKLDGSVIPPNAEWSFNSIVGPRTKERGFKEASTYLMGEVIPSLGGGMCQVSSTVHAAALLVGLDIIKRQPHSRPSGYIQPGFDATVNYPKHCWTGEQDPNVCFDLIVRNPYNFPLTVRARVHETPNKASKKTTLSVELWGTGEVAHVSTTWKLYSTPPFKRKWRRTWRKGNWKKKKQYGQNGANGGLTVTRIWPDGTEKSKVIYNRYPPVKEVWYVGQDWPEGVNPWE